MEYNTDYAKKVYAGLTKRGYTADMLGDEAMFVERMANEDNRRYLYDQVQKRGDAKMGSWEHFNSRMMEAAPQQKGFLGKAMDRITDAVNEAEEMENRVEEQLPDMNERMKQRVLQGQTTQGAFERFRKGDNYAVEGTPEYDWAQRTQMRNMFAKLPEEQRNEVVSGARAEFRAKFGREAQDDYEVFEWMTGGNSVRPEYATEDTPADDIAKYDGYSANEIKAGWGGENARDKSLISQLDSAAEKTDALLQDRDNEVRARYWKDYEKSAGTPGVYPTLQLWGEGRTMDDEWGYLKAADNINKETKMLIDAAKNDRGFWRGFGRRISDLDTWIPAETLLEYVGAKDLMDIDPDKATSGQKALMEALALRAAAEEQYEDDVRPRYKAGETVAEMIPLAAEMLVNPLSGTGKAVAKATMKKVAKKEVKKKIAGEAAEKALKKWQKKFLIRSAGFGGSLAGGYGMAATTSLPKVAANAGINSVGRAQYKVGEDGIGFGGFHGGGNYMQELGKEYVRTGNELATEQMGSEFLKKIFGGAGKLVKKVPGVQKVTDVISPKKFENLVNLAKSVNYNGPLEEFGEEFKSALFNVTVDGWASLEKFFEKDNLETLSIALVAPVVPGAAIGTGVNIWTGAYKAGTKAKVKQDAAYKRMQNVFAENPSEMEKIVRNLNDANTFANEMREIYYNPQYTFEQKKTALEYAVHTLQYLSSVGANVDTKALNDMLGGRYSEGYEAVDGNAVARANKVLRDAENAAKAALGLESDTSIEDFIGDRSVDEVAMGDESVAEALDTYFAEKAKYEGMQEKMQDTRESEYMEADKSVDAVAHEDGNVYRITLPETGETIFITGGKVVLDNEGYIDVNQSEGLVALMPNSKKEAIQAGNIRDKVVVENAQAQKAAKRAEIDARYRQQLNTFIYTDKADGTEHTVQLVSRGEQLARVILDGVEQDMPTRLYDKIVAEATAENGEVKGENVELPFNKGDVYQFGDDKVTIMDVEGDRLTLDVNGKLVLGVGKADVYAMARAAKSAQPVTNVESAPVVEDQKGENAEKVVEPSPTGEAVAPVVEAPKTALEQIPRNEKNVPLYEQVDSELAWDGVVEEAGGNEETAMVAVNSMVEDKKKALVAAEKAKARTGATITEKIAAENERVANIEKAKADLAKWEEIAGVKAKRALAAEAESKRVADEAAAKQRAEEERLRAEREEAERAEKVVATAKKKQQARFAEHAKAIAEKLGVEVTVHNDESTVTNRDAMKAITEGDEVKGWYNPNTGEIALFMPNMESMRDVESTILHEAVSHYGIKHFLGKEDFDKFLDGVWDMMPAGVRAFYLDYVGADMKNPSKAKMRQAADEYVAHIAETMDLNELEKSVWQRFIDYVMDVLRKAGFKNLKQSDVEAVIRASYANLRQNGGNSQVTGQGETMASKKMSERRQEKNRINNVLDEVGGIIYGNKEYAKKQRLKREAERKELAKEIYSSVLKGDFNDVTLSQIDKFIEDATPANPFGRRISQRLPQRMERALRQGARANAVDALFSRISESAVPANERFSEAGRRKIEERKKELLKGWAIATGNWHTDLKEFTDDTEPIGEGKDSKVYSSKDGRYVIKASKGKPFGKRFRPDIDNIALFNDVFRDTRYEILGYGEIDGEFVRILQQPIVDFAESTPLTSEERREYMQSLGFEPLNDANTAFADGEIVIADLQKGNVVRDAAGNISVIDADAKLHTKDVGGDYTYPPVETDLPEGTDLGGTMFRKVFHGSGAQFDRFDHSFMGSGEGAQAFGWGTYVTEVEGIGKAYAKKTLKNPFKTRLARIYVDDMRNAMNKGVSFEDAKKRAVELFYDQTDYYRRYGGGDVMLEDYERLANMTEEDMPMHHLYSVEVPDDNGSNYLHWEDEMSDELIADIIGRLPKEKLIKAMDRDKVADMPFVERVVAWNEQLFPGEGKTGETIYDVVEYALGSDKAASEFLNDLGFVGISYPAEATTGGRADGARNYVIFNENDAVIEDRTMFRKANYNQEVFVSNAQRAVEGIKQEKATPEQWIAMLKKNGGLKAGEEAWLGLEEWLMKKGKVKGENGKVEPVTKQEILDFIGENKIQIEEVEYRDDASDNYAGTKAFLQAVEEQLEEDARYHAESEVYPDEFDTEEDYLYAIRSAIREYKEDPTGVHYDIAAEKVARRGDGPNLINSTRLGYTTEGLDNKREIALTVPTIEPYNASDEVHFGDAGEGRAIAWVRFGETTDSEGNRVLVIDEIQSKRHQDGREKGYRGVGLAKEVLAAEEEVRKTNRELTAYREPLKEKYNFKKLGGSMFERLKNFDAMLSEEERITMDALGQARNEAEKRLQELRGQERGIPSAPFEKNWHELAMKRMLRLAAEEGFDKVAWTTGEQQAERYDMSKVVSHIACDKVGKNGNKSFSMGLDYKFIVDPNGIVISSKDEYVGKSLADIVGKPLANKMLEMQEGDTISGDGLRIGGEGMKGFYDKMLPSFVSKYTKKWGAKVGTVEMPSLEQNNVMHSVDVTPEMTESVMEGQTMFSKAHALDNFKLTQDNQSDFSLAIRNSIAPGWSDYVRVGDMEIRVKEHTPNWDNFEDFETGEAKAKKILNVTVGDYNNTDYRRYKGEYEEFVENHPDVVAVDVEIEDGTYLGDALEKIHKALQEKGVDFEFISNDAWVEQYSEENNDLSNSQYIRFRKVAPEQDIPVESVQAKTKALKENAKAIRRLHNVTSKYPITALRNLGFALETQEQREMHDRLFAERDAITGESMPAGLQTNPQTMTLQERITESLLKHAEQAKENVEMRLSAIRAYGRDLANVIKLMNAQKGYDRHTVEMFTNLVKMYLRNNAMKGMSSYEIIRLLNLMQKATGGREKVVYNSAVKIAEIITYEHTRQLEEIMEKQTKTGAERVNASGVVVQGGVDIIGKRILNTYKDAINLDDKGFEEKYNSAFERVGKIQKQIQENGSNTALENQLKEAEAEADAMLIAATYRNDIKAANTDIDELKEKLREKREAMERGEVTRKEYYEFANTINAQIIQSRAQQIDAYQRVLHALSGDIYEGVQRARAFREAEAARVQKIHDMAESDMNGVSKSAERKEKGVVGKTVDMMVYKNPITRAVMHGLGTYENYMKYFGRDHLDGRGELFEYFMTAFNQAQDKEWKESQNDFNILEAAARKIFGKKKIGKTYKTIARDSTKGSGVILKYWDGGAMVERKLTIGQLMYLYMTEKQAEGQMKLRNMGLTEEKVQNAVAKLPAKYKAFADYIQAEFLPQMRPRMNEVHQRMFGASMSEVENYFPLKVNQDARKGDTDLNNTGDAIPSTITGAVIKRRVNVTPIDLTANAFDVLNEHIVDMEHWAAFAEFTRDNNTLINDNDFKNRVKNTKSVRHGDGEKIWEDFVETARITTGNYQQRRDYIAKLMSGANAAKITFGYYTALKQLSSLPAFLADANAIDLVWNTANAYGSWQWAIKNLPGFEKRWKNRTGGNERLGENEYSIHDSRIMKVARKAGMTPNAFIDAAVVAAGARAVYNTRLRFYKSLGLTEYEADKRAKNDAAISYNETQQSGQGAYLSRLQKEGGIAALLTTLFRNSQMAFQRRVVGSLVNTGKKLARGERIREATKRKYMQMGVNEADAKKQATMEFYKSFAKDFTNLAIFGYGMNYLWVLMGQLPYLLFGDDDEEKEKIYDMAKKVGVTGMFEGFTLGNVAKAYYENKVNGTDYAVSLLEAPFEQDLDMVLSRFEKDGTMAGILQLGMFLTEMNTGISPQRLIDDAAAVIDFCDGDVELANDGVLFALRLLKAPQSQQDMLILDELEGADAERVKKVAEKFIEYKMKRNFPFGSEDEKRVDKYANKFVETLKERVEKDYDPEDISVIFDQSSDTEKEILKKKWIEEMDKRNGTNVAKSLRKEKLQELLGSPIEKAAQKALHKVSKLNPYEELETFEDIERWYDYKVLLDVFQEDYDKLRKGEEIPPEEREKAGIHYEIYKDKNFKEIVNAISTHKKLIKKNDNPEWRMGEVRRLTDKATDIMRRYE